MVARLFSQLLLLPAADCQLPANHGVISGVNACVRCEFSWMAGGVETLRRASYFTPVTILQLDVRSPWSACICAQLSSMSTHCISLCRRCLSARPSSKIGERLQPPLLDDAGWDESGLSVLRIKARIRGGSAQFFVAAARVCLCSTERLAYHVLVLNWKAKTKTD